MHLHALAHCTKATAATVAISMLGACECTVNARPGEDVPDENTTRIHMDDGRSVHVDLPKAEVAAILNKGPYGRALLREVDTGIYVVPNRVTALE